MAAGFEAVCQATAAERVRPSQHLQILLQTVHPVPHTAPTDDCLSTQPGNAVTGMLTIPLDLLKRPVYAEFF